MKNKAALITGASSGIGKAYAGYLASLGYDLTLVARREDVLSEVAEEIKKKHPVSINILPADLSSHEGLMKMKDMLATGKSPEVLVHAAGFGTRGLFYELDPGLIEKQVFLMTVAPAVLTSMVLPGMMERKEGIIIHVSSVAAYISTAQYTVYSAVKTFLNSFVTGLRDELAATDIKVQSVCPGLTRTGFMHTSHYKEKGFDYSFIPEKFWMEPEEVVEESWKRLNKNYKPVVVTGRNNKILVRMLTAPFIGPMFKRRISRKVRKKIKKGLPVNF